MPSPGVESQLLPMERPAISVIVIAHQRAQFLQEAVDSAMQQSLPRNAFEVIVVKDFQAPELDHYLDRLSVRRVESLPTLTAGAMFSAGIEQATGDILCFLDDDDRFLPTKLSTIIELFNSRPDVGYIRCRPLFVNSAGSPLARQWEHRHEGHEKLVELRTATEFSRAHVQCEIGFNNSSISIRRETLTPWIREFSRVRVNCDNFLLLVSLLSHTGILCTDRVLNEFRIHEAGSSGEFTGGTQTDFYAGRRSYFGKALEDAEFFLEMVRGSVAEPTIEYFRDYCRALYEIADARPHRQVVGRSLLGMLVNPHQRAMYSGRLPSTVSMAAVLLAYLAAPRSATWAYYHAKKMTSLRSVKTNPTQHTSNSAAVVSYDSPRP